VKEECPSLVGTQAFMTSLPASGFLAGVLCPSLKLGQLCPQRGPGTCPQAEDRQLLLPNPFISPARVPPGRHARRLQRVGGREQGVTPRGADRRDAATGRVARPSGRRAAGPSPPARALSCAECARGRAGASCRDHPLPTRHGQATSPSPAVPSVRTHPRVGS